MIRWIKFGLAVVIMCTLIGCTNQVKKANELIDLGSTDQAVTLLNEVIMDNPKNAEAHFSLGVALRKKGDIPKSQESFESAIKASPDMKDKVIKTVLANKDIDYPDLCFVNEVDPNYVKENEDFAYSYLADNDEPAEAYKFAEYFPKSSRAPRALLYFGGLAYREEQFGKAKSTYQKIVSLYPESSEAREAKAHLADWWEFTEINIQLNGSWQGRSIKKGQSYRYSFTNEYNDICIPQMFIGTKDDLQLGLSPESDPRYQAEDRNRKFTGPLGPTMIRANDMKQAIRSVGNSGSGVAPRDGMIWFDIDTCIAFRGNVTVKLELKDM